jgi:hypothetical protein
MKELLRSIYKALVGLHRDETGALITKPFTHSTGQPALASEVNANMDTIVNDYNGNIDTDNIASDAGITNAQIAENTLNIERMNLQAYIGGLRCKNGTDGDHDVDIAAGICRDADNTEGLTLGTAITKQIDASWAVGTNAGGLDTGSVAADTMYAIWLIKRTDTDVVDALFSTSFTAPTMPTNYDKKRLIMAVCTDSSSNIVPFSHFEDYVRYNDPILDVNDGTITSVTFEIGTLSVCPSSVAHIYVRMTNATSTDTDGYVNVRQNGALDGAVAAEAFLSTNMGGVTFDEFTTQGLCSTDDAGKVQYAAYENSGAATVQIRTIGFFMMARSNPAIPIA